MIPTESPVLHRVLLVDDDDAVRGMMSATLERKGFDVVTAANVTEALRLITVERFDVLIAAFGFNESFAYAPDDVILGLAASPLGDGSTGGLNVLPDVLLGL